MDKKQFIRAVTVLWDSREKSNQHILDGLDHLGAQHESRKLDIGDYSFSIAGRDFATACSIERKSGAEEIYFNLMEKTAGSTNRLEKELDAGNRLLNQFTMLVEGVGSMEALKAYVVPDWKMKMTPQRIKADIGATCYASLRAWQAANRHNFRVEFVMDPQDVSTRILEEFYFYYHNYKKLLAPRR